jgi:hypothetical protein
MCELAQLNSLADNGASDYGLLAILFSPPEGHTIRSMPVRQIVSQGYLRCEASLSPIGTQLAN